MNRVNEERTMKECLLAAFKDHAVISSDGLSSSEFIHVYKHKAYYEDGGCLGHFSETMELLDSQDWTHNHKWFIVGYLTDEEIKAINEMRQNPMVYDSFWFDKKIHEILDFN